MQRSLLILSASVFLVACQGKSPWATTTQVDHGTGTVNGASVAVPASDVKFSWDKASAENPTPKEVVPVVVEAPKDANKARVLDIRDDSGLISLLRADKPDIKARLQLVKDGKALLVEVVRVSDKNEIIANIIPNQEKTPKLAAGDEVACGVLAATAQ